MPDWLPDFLNGSLLYGPFYQIASAIWNTAMSACMGIMTKTPEGFSSATWTYVNNELYPWALSIGIMSLNFKENMTIELMIEAMIKVVVLNVLLVKGLDVIKKIFEMASVMAGTAVMIEPPAFFTGDVDVGSVMFFWIYGLFYFLVAMVCAFLILITLYSRYIKLYHFHLQCLLSQEDVESKEQPMHG